MLGPRIVLSSNRLWLGTHSADCCNLELQRHKGNTVSTCVQHITSVIYRALYNSVERNRERTGNLTNLNVSALPGSSLTSCTFARAVLNSLNKSTHSISDISLIGFTFKLGSSRTVMIRSSCMSVSVCFQRLSFNLAGDLIYPNSFFHNLVVCFDRFAARQKTILVTELSFHQLNT